MADGQILFRDFGEKVSCLVGAGVDGERLSDRVRLEDVHGFPPFRKKSKLAAAIGIHSSTINHWSNDQRHPHGFRLAPKFENAARIAQIFGICPKPNDDRDILTFWQQEWPSWYSEDASDQYDKDYNRPVGGDGKPDSHAAFLESYVAALKTHQTRPEHSRLCFIDVERPEENRPKVLRELVRLIQRAPEVLALLQGVPGIEDLPQTISAATDEEKSAAIHAAATWLLDADVDLIVHVFYDAVQATNDIEGDRERETIHAVLLEIALWLVPAQCNYADVAQIMSTKDQGLGRLIELPVYRRTIVDLVVAAAEGRAASYHPRQSEDDWPVGTASFADQNPDSGFDADDNEVKGIKELLARKLTSTNQEEIYEAVAEFTKGMRYYTPEPASSISHEREFTAAGRILSKKMKLDKRSYYLMFRNRQYKDDRQALDQIVHDIHEKIPGMLFFGLSDNEATELREIDRFYPFVLILPIGQDGAAA